MYMYKKIIYTIFMTSCQRPNGIVLISMEPPVLYNSFDMLDSLPFTDYYMLLTVVYIAFSCFCVFCVSMYFMYMYFYNFCNFVLYALNFNLTDLIF